MTRAVWIHIDPLRARPWCALVRAVPGGRIVTLCAELNYEVLPISTDEPHDMCCAACLARLGGREIAVPCETDDDLAIARETTADLRGPSMLAVEASGEWT